MKILEDKIEVETRPADAVHGAKPEPEERPATRVMVTDGASTGYGAGVSTDGRGGSIEGLPNGVPKKMAASITSTQTVAEFAAKATMCGGCVHFDNAQWLKTFGKWRMSKDPFEIAELEQLRASLANAKGQFRQTGAGDVDSSISVMGLCKAYTKMFKDMNLDPAVTWVHPMSVCPGTHRARPDLTLPKMYRERKTGIFTSLKDKIFRIAQGRSSR